MKFKKGHFYELCEGCCEFFELDKETAVFHYHPDDENDFENNLSIDKTEYPHCHMFLSLCPKCRKGNQHKLTNKAVIEEDSF